MNPNTNADKWNDRYANQSESYSAPVRNLLSENNNLIPASGWALEIAGGLGVSSAYLQNAGLQVVEIDISYQALKRAASLNSRVIHIAADAEFLPIRDMKFALICNFYFFDRNIIPTIKRMLGPGGIIFFETLTREILSVRPEIPPEFLLTKGELEYLFSDFEILHSFEGWTDSDHGKRKSIGSLIARKPYNSV